MVVTPSRRHVRHVLVVDDQSMVRDILERILSSEGFIVHKAEDGRSALEEFRKHETKIDLVILDVKLPGLTGPEVLTQLRLRKPKLSALFVTGDSSQLDPDVPANAILEKPFRKHDLVAAIERIRIQDGSLV